MKKRTKARELALQFLYQVDLRGDALAEEARAWIRGEEQDADTCRYAERIILGVVENKDELDGVIQNVAQNWQISRMAVIDRNVIRLAAFELLHCPDIPPKVAINEAIEIGKRYSTSNSGSFINGILDRIMNRKEGQDPEPLELPDATVPGITTVGEDLPDPEQSETHGTL